MNITIYSTPSCPYCLLAKRYFDEKKLPYIEHNVAENQEKAQEMIKISGQMGVPVVKINDKIIIGFNQAEIEEVLKQGQ